MSKDLLFSAFSPEERVEKFSELSHSDTLDCGWIPPHKRSGTQKQNHNNIARSVPRFSMPRQGVYKDSTKVCLWDCWKLAKADYNPLGMHQITGCCVGAGGGQMLWSLQAADLVKRGDKGSAHIPLWLYPYGESRTLLGETRQGEGSTGTTFAQAVQQFGYYMADVQEQGIPKFQNGDGYIWGQQTEMQFSIASGTPQNIREESKIYLVKTFAKTRTTDDVRDGIKNFYGVTCASDWGGLMTCQVQGSKDPVLMSKHVTSWNHQMSVHGWWDHPELGEIFHIKNNWGDCHGHDPSGAPPGGFWISKKDMQYIIDQDETFVFSQFTEFPPVEEPLDFSAF